MFTFGAHSDLIHVDAGGSREPTSVDTLAQGAHHFRMRGREVAQFVRDHMPSAVTEVLAEHRVEQADVAHVVPHQANGRMIETLGKDLGLPRAQVHSTVEQYGNTGSASAAVTLDEAARGGHLHPGDLVLLVTFGGGMSAGTALLRWSPLTRGKRRPKDSPGRRIRTNQAAARSSVRQDTKEVTGRPLPYR